MRWCYQIERASDKKFYVSAWLDGRPGLGHAKHRNRQKAMKAAERHYLEHYPMTLSEVFDRVKVTQ